MRLFLDASSRDLRWQIYDFAGGVEDYLTLLMYLKDMGRGEEMQQLVKKRCKHIAVIRDSRLCSIDGYVCAAISKSQDRDLRIAPIQPWVWVKCELAVCHFSVFPTFPQQKQICNSP